MPGHDLKYTLYRELLLIGGRTVVHTADSVINQREYCTSGDAENDTSTRVSRAGSPMLILSRSSKLLRAKGESEVAGRVDFPRHSTMRFARGLNPLSGSCSFARAS